MKAIRTIRLGLALAAGVALFGAAPGLTEIRPSSDVLMPYFEVELKDAPEVARTTLFAVCNDADDPVGVKITVLTNWGVPVLQHSLTLKGEGVQTVNLRDWLVRGELPGRTLSTEELAHLQAALSGEASPRDGKYYSSQVAPGVAVGAVTFSVEGVLRPDVLWGDSFIVDPSIGFSEGETLVNIDPSVECLTECTRHGVRFLSGGAFDGGTELMVWTRHAGAPSASPEYPEGQRISATAEVYDEEGNLIAEVRLKLLPLETIKISDLGLTEPFGWIDLVTDENSFITAHYSASDRYSSALHAWCLPEKQKPQGPGIRVDKLTNGVAADLPTGPRVAVGSVVRWTYEVTNTGDVTLAGIVVTDSDGVTVSCPEDTLGPGESMICEATGPAEACQHANTATATGTPPSGGPVSDTDISHYYGEQEGALSLRAMINGADANSPPGPTVQGGAALHWTYTVTNTGTIALSGLSLTDQHGYPVSCPKTVLGEGESMTCTADAMATSGQHAFTATVEGLPECGAKASASDPTHYYTPPPPLIPAITIEKLTNGQDADNPPGPVLPAGSAVTWTYLVTNTGEARLTAVTVTDDRGVAVACPKTVLEPAESMTCTASGTATAGQYHNVGTAWGMPPNSLAVTASDPSHYFGVQPRVQLEKLVNGFEADTSASAPTLVVGTAVTWTYVVTNTGDTVLTALLVTDDHGVAVSCPKTVLQPAESMTCTGNGTAVAGPYCNLGLVTGTAPVGPAVTANDPACYRGVSPGITIEKRVNGQDADTPTGPKVLKGSTVTWTYVVTNIGDTTLTGVAVTDDKGVAVSCPKTVLQPAESMTCTAGGKAVSGQYCNVGTVNGTANGGSVQASDPACYFGIWPDIRIEKLTNGEDADQPPGPTINVGAQVLWTYVVTNTGDVPLFQVQVTDNRGVAVSCPKTVLAPAESMTCTASKKAVEGQYSNVGTVTGTPDDAPAVTDSDPSHYKGKKVCYQGCSPGYWKYHTSSWPATGYTTGQAVLSVFIESYRYPALADSTLRTALAFSGGSGLEGAAKTLLRQAVAAVLNAAHPGITYPRTQAQVVEEVNAALASNNRDAMLSLAAVLDYDNNRDCPLD